MTCLSSYYKFDYPIDSDDEEEERFLLFECAHCHGRLKKPKVMPKCGHQICKNCSGNILLHSHDKTVIYCVDCGSRNRISTCNGLQTDFQLQRILEVMDKTDPLDESHYSHFLSKRQSQGCPHFALVNTPRICRHCDAKMCENCFLFHLEIVRLEIGWYGHRLVERFDNAIRHHPTKTAETVESVRVTTAKISREIAELFKNAESVLTFPPEKLIDLYHQVVNNDKEVLTLEHCLIEQEDKPVREIKLQPDYKWWEGYRLYGPPNYVPIEKQRFYDAIDAGDLTTIRKILENQQLPEPCRTFIISHYRLTESLFGTALHYAANYGYADVVRYLVEEQGAEIAAVCPYNDSDDSRKMAIHFAAANGHLEVVKLLTNYNGEMVEAEDSFGYTPLLAAALYRYRHVLDYLIDEKGANVNHDSCGETAFSRIFSYSVDEEEKEENDFALYLIRKGCRAVIKDQFIAKKALKRGMFSDGHQEIAKCILMEKPKFADCFTFNNNGMTLLQTAAAKGYLEIVTILVKTCRVNVERKCGRFGRTALHYAVGHLEVVKFLVEEAGANVMAMSDAEKDNKSTPAHLAAKYGERSAVDYLLSRNPELACCKDLVGQTPLQITLTDGCTTATAV